MATVKKHPTVFLIWIPYSVFIGSGLVLHVFIPVEEYRNLFEICGQKFKPSDALKDLNIKGVAVIWITTSTLFLLAVLISWIYYWNTIFNENTYTLLHNLQENPVFLVIISTLFTIFIFSFLESSRDLHYSIPNAVFNSTDVRLLSSGGYWLGTAAVFTIAVSFYFCRNLEDAQFVFVTASVQLILGILVLGNWIRMPAAATPKAGSCDPICENADQLLHSVSLSFTLAWGAIFSLLLIYTYIVTILRIEGVKLNIKDHIPILAIAFGPVLANPVAEFLVQGSE